MARTRATVIAALASVIVMTALGGCETTPPPPVVGDLTAKDIEYALADSMMITFNSILFIMRESDDPEPNGSLERDGLTLEWAEADLQAEVGEFTIELQDYLLQSSLFGNIYKKYVVTGTVYMLMDGEEATLIMDLTLTHDRPDKYPIRSLEVNLSGLEENIDPGHVEGYIKANGYDVPLDFSRSLQIDN